MDLTRVIVTSSMLRLVAEIDAMKSRWVASASLEPERLRALKRVATIESIGSSTRIEGSRLSDEEVASLLGRLTIESFEDRDQQEVAGYARAMELVFESYEFMPPTEPIVAQLHRDLLQYSPKDERHRGRWKRHSNAVGAFGPDGSSIGVVFQTATPFETPRRMEELLGELGDELTRREHHPLIVIGCFVVEFLAIHPFQDGNGRLSRILTGLMLLRSGYVYTPYASIESIIERSKDRYYGALRASQQGMLEGAPDYGPWLEFFLEVLQRQVVHLQRVLDRDAPIPPADAAREPLAPPLRAILELVVEHDGLALAQLADLTGTPRSTLKDRLRWLVAEGHLALHGRGRASWYSVGPSSANRGGGPGG